MPYQRLHQGPGCALCQPKAGSSTSRQRSRAGSHGGGGCGSQRDACWGVWHRPGKDCRQTTGRAPWRRRSRLATPHGLPGGLPCAASACDPHTLPARRHSSARCPQRRKTRSRWRRPATAPPRHRCLRRSGARGGWRRWAVVASDRQQAANASRHAAALLQGCFLHRHAACAAQAGFSY